MMKTRKNHSYESNNDQIIKLMDLIWRIIRLSNINYIYILQKKKIVIRLLHL